MTEPEYSGLDFADIKDDNVIRAAFANRMTPDEYRAKYWRDDRPERLPPAEQKPIAAMAFGDFMAMAIPPRERLLTPWLPAKGITMVYAPRGVGKTFFALETAYAVATGGQFLKWRAEKSRRVLLIDGEMPAVIIQERLAAIVQAAPMEPPAHDTIRILAYDMLDQGGPNLFTAEGHAALEPVIGDAELIVIDNLATVARGGRENEAESWGTVQGWALAQRRAGRSVLFIHHAGKGGDQRGTSSREDVMDSVIRLSRPDDYQPTQGARFVVEFTKTRGFTGKDAAPFEATLIDGRWAIREVEDVRASRVWALKDEGLTQREIAAEMGISLGLVNKLLRQPREAGETDTNGCT